MSELSKRIADLSPEHLDLLFDRLNEQNEVTVQEETIAPRSDAGSSTPLSFAQERLWFLDRLMRGTNVYNIHGALRIDGVLNTPALERALGEIIRRHEILRTTISTIDGNPVQVIAAPSEFELQVTDLGSLPEEDRETKALSLAAAEARWSFDLSKDRLFRPALIRLSEQRHILNLTMHHMVSDGWSFGILIDELTSLYASFCNDNPSSLPTLPIQYADFAIWQREQLQGEKLEALLSYWKKQLDSAPAVIELPTDRPRPPVQSYQGAAVPFVVSKKTSEALKRLSNEEGATLFMTLLAAFETFLSRYTGKTDVLIGTPAAGRNRIETEKLIGLFLNTLVIRADTSGDPTFCELLDRVRGVTLEAYAHQDLPFEKLVDELHLERTLSHAALIQVMFVFQNIPMPDFDLAGLNLRQIEVESDTAKFDLNLTMMDEGGELSGYLEYNTDLFHSETIARLLANFQTLLEGIAANPRRRLSALPLLTETEQRTLLTEWNSPDITFPARDCIHHTFEKQAAAIPEAVAVICGDQSTTYRELNERANQLAHYLKESDVRPDMLVCICIDHSIEMLVGLLGVLKAGGTYVPLDPGYPKERLAYMLDDTGAPVLLTKTEQLEKLPTYAGKVVCLDRDWTEIASHSQEDLHVPSAPDSPAYVIYTSGSTGNPKGAVVTHRNVERLFEATDQWFHFGRQDVWTLFHSFAFDFSVWEIWGALLHGGRLVVVPHRVSRTPEAFYELLSNERVTVLNQTPSAFRQLMNVDEKATRELDLRLVIFGGEALDIPSLGPWFDRHGDRKPELINMYGITETTVHVTYRPITKADVRKGAASCVGKGIADLQVYVLDENLQLAPIGVAGELFVGGGGLAQGYLNRADLTAARFIPNSFSQRAGERLYKTGDLARYSGQGDIEYLGRIDHQVKIRGFRIELGEIEAALSQCTGVRDVAVLAREDESGDKRLVAYVVTDRDQTVTGSELRSSLIEKLPDYMVPAAFVMLDSLPLTPNGKLDTRLLLSSNLERPEPEETFAAPRTWVEEALAHVWAQVLDLDRVGIHDNFFALGGDSILSVRAVSRMKERGLNFSLEQLFRHQTICELAQQFEKIEAATGEIKTEPFSLVSEEDRAKLPADLEDAYPLTRGQTGLFYQMELTPSSPVYHNVDTLSFRVSRFDADALEKSVERVVARHPIMRTSFDLANYSEPLQLVHKTARLPVVVEDVRHLSPAEQEEALADLVAKEREYRFDLSQAPLLRFHVHRMTDEVFHLTQTESHPVHDGWSMNSMLVEMFKHYTALLDGHVLPEEAPTASFRDFVYLEKQALASEESRRFWNEKLSDLTSLKLPAPEATADDSQEYLHVVPLSSDKFKKLEQLARNLAIPLKSLLLAAHVKTLSFVSGERDVLTGLASHGRAAEAGGELARGFFLNIMPFRMKLQDGTWSDLARDAFKLELDALPHRRYPLSELQSKHGREALFETVFNFINFHILDELSPEGVEMLGLSHSINVTHFALTTTFSLNKWYWGTHFEDASMIIALQYDPAKLSREFVESLSEYYVNVLDRMASDPLSHHGGRGLLTAADEQRVVVGWNNTFQDYVLENDVSRLVEAQVEANPEAVAVVCGSDRLSYQELNGKANRLARHLQQRGIVRESVVGICVNRSVDSVVAALACLKAGAAFLPLDPLYPAHRLRVITEDAQMALLLSHSTLAERLPDGPTAVIWMDEVWEQCRGLSEENLGLEIDPRNLAYVIYTSGSTGTPKGVAIEHVGLANLVQWHIKEYQLTAADRATQVASPGFDAAVWEVWPYLCAGASLYIVDDETRASVRKLKEYFVNNGITMSFLPTPLAEVILEEWEDDCVELRGVLTGGDKLRRRPRAGAGYRLYNHYGPTENTVVATGSEVPAGEVGTEPTIGKPISNVQTYVLDENLNAVPVGVKGELYIGGVALARGYIHDPEKTAERFVADPFSREPGARLYRTGDLVRWAASGEIEFLGRLDDQVKIRGFRIEPGEVEVALLQHPSVKEAVVVPRESAPGERILVAYVVTGESVGPVALRNHLRERLPDHLLPSAFVTLDRLPLNAHGKIDRRALPDPERGRAELETVYEAPRTEAERTIAGIWRDVLQVDEVGVNDNFFDLGGHSILMIQAHSRLQNVFDNKIPLVELFQYPTVSALAVRLTQGEQPLVEQGRERADTRKESMKQKTQLGNRRRQARA